MWQNEFILEDFHLVHVLLQIAMTCDNNTNLSHLLPVSILFAGVKIVVHVGSTVLTLKSDIRYRKNEESSNRIALFTLLNDNNCIKRSRNKTSQQINVQISEELSFANKPWSAYTLLRTFSIISLQYFVQDTAEISNLCLFRE